MTLAAHTTAPPPGTFWRPVPGEKAKCDECGNWCPVAYRAAGYHIIACGSCLQERGCEWMPGRGYLEPAPAQPTNGHPEALPVTPETLFLGACHCAAGMLASGASEEEAARAGVKTARIVAGLL